MAGRSMMTFGAINRLVVIADSKVLVSVKHNSYRKLLHKLLKSDFIQNMPTYIYTNINIVL